MRINQISEMHHEEFSIGFDQKVRLEDAARLLGEAYQRFIQQPVSFRGPHHREGNQKYCLIERVSGHPDLEILTFIKEDPSRVFDVSRGCLCDTKIYLGFFEHLKELAR